MPLKNYTRIPQPETQKRPQQQHPTFSPSQNPNHPNPTKHIRPQIEGPTTIAHARRQREKPLKTYQKKYPKAYL